MSTYELLLFLHLAAVTIWLGAGFLLAIQMFAAERARDLSRRLGVFRDVGWLSQPLFIPASLSTMIFGVLLVIDGPWGFDQLWVNIGLTGWLVSFLLGFFYFKPTGERIGKMLAEGGAPGPDVDLGMRRVSVVDRLQVTILFVVLAAMVFKPTGDDTGMLVVGAAILVVALGLMVLGLRREAQAAAS